ncbi:uncharacterized protein LOC123891415 [Trifolium pratense]|uniref:Uncharacterized protein n=1 Tax=Trifolium pratense TaxID=57577 RepID=A0ACB0LWT0_TRIPR|nr:uncharacterized protein LOC123891415 [Trifolium pratense]CAJ2673330.1 unnamed protein product [Trifolium pratense]
MFDTHTLVISANRVTQWNDNVDTLTVKWDGESVTIPSDGDTEWKTNTDEREVVVERTNDTISVRVTVSGLLEMDIRVRPIGEKEKKLVKRGVAMPMMEGEDNYQTPSLFSTSCKLCRFQRPSTSQGLIAQY